MEIVFKTKFEVGDIVYCFDAHQDQDIHKGKIVKAYIDFNESIDDNGVFYDVCDDNNTTIDYAENFCYKDKIECVKAFVELLFDDTPCAARLIEEFIYTPKNKKK